MVSSKLVSIIRSLLSHSDDSWYGICMKAYKNLISAEYEPLGIAIQTQIDTKTISTESLQTTVSSFLTSFVEEGMNINTLRSEIIDVIIVAFYLTFESSETVEEGTMKWNLFEALGDIPMLNVKNIGSMLTDYDLNLSRTVFYSYDFRYYICIDPISNHYIIKEFDSDIPIATRSGSCDLLLKIFNIPENYVCYPIEYFKISEHDAFNYGRFKDDLYGLEHNDIQGYYYKEDLEYVQEQLGLLERKISELIEPSFKRRRHLLDLYFRNYD